MKKKTVLLVGVLLLFLDLTPVHAAPITVPSDLNPGDPYRLVFVTSGWTQATSPSICHYNSFVTAEAATSPELWALETEWRAIGSTQTVDAVVNTYTGSQSGSPGVPIYNLRGALVAADYDDLWDGDIVTCIDVDQHGVLFAPNMFEPTWTGTTPYGRRSDAPLGGTERENVRPVFYCVTYGLPTLSNDWNWVDGGESIDNTEYRHMCAMSGILTMPQPVPAPTSILLLSSGIFGLLRERGTSLNNPISGQRDVHKQLNNWRFATVKVRSEDFKRQGEPGRP